MSPKANSMDDNQAMYEEVKVEDIEIYSPFKHGKSESVHSPSGSLSGSNKIEGNRRRPEK